jgi:hypothetical protein
MSVNRVLGYLDERNPQNKQTSWLLYSYGNSAVVYLGPHAVPSRELTISNTRN